MSDSRDPNRYKNLLVAALAAIVIVLNVLRVVVEEKENLDGEFVADIENIESICSQNECSSLADIRLLTTKKSRYGQVQLPQDHGLSTGNSINVRRICNSSGGGVVCEYSFISKWKYNQAGR